LRGLDEIVAANSSLRAGVLLDLSGNVLDCSGEKAADPDMVAASVTMARPQLQAALDHLGMGKCEAFALGTTASSLHVRYGAAATAVLVGVENKSVDVLQRKLEPLMSSLAASIAEAPR
jgi:hypothetical protein